MEVADQTFYLTQLQYTDTRPTSPSHGLIVPGTWQVSHWSASFYVTGMIPPGKIHMAQVGTDSRSSAVMANTLSTRPMGCVLCLDKPSGLDFVCGVVWSSFSLPCFLVWTLVWSNFFHLIPLQPSTAHLTWHYAQTGMHRHRHAHTYVHAHMLLLF